MRTNLECGTIRGGRSLHRPAMLSHFGLAVFRISKIGLRIKPRLRLT